MSRKAVLAMLGVLVAVAPSARAQPCEPHWSPLGAGMNDYVRWMVVWDDDGPGPHAPALYAVGQFTTAGGLPANGAAKWDGVAWSPLGSGLTGGYGPITVAVFDDDGDGPHLPALYVGGNFTTAGGVPANNIAKWDGTTWSALGAGTNNWVVSLTSCDDDGPGPHPPVLYAGGFFSTAGGVPASAIARWDGTSWSAVSGGMGGVSPVVYSLYAWDDDKDGVSDLYAGGLFTSAGGVPANCIAKWNGVSWSALGGGMSYDVYAFAAWDDDGPGPDEEDLYVGGAFFTAGGQLAHGIAKWDRASWSPVGIGTNNAVHGLTVFDDDGPGPHPTALYASGYFTMAGDNPANHIAKWNGRRWSALGSGMNDYVMCVIGFDADGDGPNPPALIGGGRYTTAGGQPYPKIAAWTSPCAILGDLNCDAVVDAYDIRAFMLALMDESLWAATYPGCDQMLGDINGDDSVDMLDLPGFVDLLIAD